MGPPPALGFVKQMVRHAFYPDLEEHLLVGEAVQPLFHDRLPIIGRRWCFFGEAQAAFRGVAERT